MLRLRACSLVAACTCREWGSNHFRLSYLARAVADFSVQASPLQQSIVQGWSLYHHHGGAHLVSACGPCSVISVKVGSGLGSLAPCCGTFTRPVRSSGTECEQVGSLCTRAALPWSALVPAVRPRSTCSVSTTSIAVHAPSLFMLCLVPGAQRSGAPTGLPQVVWCQKWPPLSG